jgi:hypothetical protein
VHLVEDNAIVRGMVRVEPGDDLVTSLEGIAFAAGWREAFVTGAGGLDLVELATGEATVALERVEIVSLTGHVVRREGRAEVRLHAQVLADGTLHTGRIAAALGGEALLVVDAALVRAAKASPTTMDTRPRSAPAPMAPSPFGAQPSAGQPVSMDAIPAPRGSSPGFGSSLGAKPMIVPVGRGDAPVDADESEHWAEVAAGDVLVHPQLGTCDVVGEDESGGMRVRIASGRICVLRLDTLEIAAPAEDESGRNVYRVIGPKRRR